MARMNIVLTEVNEKWLRERNRKRGDMSDIINALVSLARKHDDIRELLAREMTTYKTEPRKKEK